MTCFKSVFHTSMMAGAIALMFNAQAQAQHFAVPDDPDLSMPMLVGEPCNSIPRPTTSFGSVAHDGWLYVMGGYHGRPHAYNRDGQSREFYRINLHDLSHQEMLPNNQGMQSCPLEAWNGKIIRTGGLVATNAPDESSHPVSLSTVSSYDPATKQWTALADMPAGRSSHDTAIIDSTLYVFGGWNLDADSGSRDWYSDVWTLDLADPEAKWIPHDAPFKRRAMASVAVDGKVMIIGGMTPGGTTNEVNLYDPETNTWSEGPSYPEQAFGIAADNVDGMVVASGVDGGVLGWSPQQENWEPLGTTTFPRFFHQIAADHNGDILILGGISGGMRPSQIERVAIGTGGDDDPIVRHWVVPSPSNAKNRQAFFVRNGWIYMFGGNNSTGQHDFESHNFLAEGYRLNPATMTWRPCSDYPMPRQSVQTHMDDDGKTGFALGGFGYGEDTAHTHIEGCTYDFKDNSWKVTGPHLPVSRSQFGLAKHGDEYWVFGGLDYDSRRESGDHFRHLADVMMANPGAGHEEFIDSGIDLPRTRRAFGGVTVGDRYYMLGGMTDNFELVPVCDVFDFDEKKWSQIAQPERTRLSPEAVVLGKHIFLAGGMSPKVDESGLEPNKSLEMYDTQTNTWTTIVEDLPFALRHITMMPFRGQLMIFTSHESDANMAHVVLINPYKGMHRNMQMARMSDLE
ncbi:MAG: hypothetical protein CMJ39_03565 [Phycisphaerae bacterium]|nr:hypothetical protein [Phycisphaerae bacterium]